MLLLLSTTIHLIPDVTIFPLLGIFLAVLTVLTFFIFRPVLRIIDVRHEATEGERERAANLERALDENEADSRHKSGRAQENAAKMRETMRQNALVTARMLIEEGRSAREYIVTRGAETHESYRATVSEEITAQIPEMAALMTAHALMEPEEEQR